MVTSRAALKQIKYQTHLNTPFSVRKESSSQKFSNASFWHENVSPFGHSQQKKIRRKCRCLAFLSFFLNLAMENAKHSECEANRVVSRDAEQLGTLNDP